MGLSLELAHAGGFDLVCIGSLELVAWDDVDALLRAAHERNLVILGIEGFRLIDHCAAPEMDAIADFSQGVPQLDASSVSIEEARAFLQKVGCPELYFDFVWKQP